MSADVNISGDTSVIEIGTPEEVTSLRVSD